MIKKQMRLGKLAGELNMSISLVYEVFQFNGVFIELDPNFKLSDEDVDSFVKYYGRFEELKEINLRIKKNELLQFEKPKYTNYSTLIGLKSKLGEPKTLFKFLGNNMNTIDSLKNNYLYHSYYLDFNDPFDCSSFLIDVQGNESSQKRKLFMETLNRSMELNGICCFSRNKDSILMWSHYANKHKGICLEFENEDVAVNTLDVNYVRNFYKPDLIREHGNALYHLIYTKSDEWAYEQEVRALLKVESNNKESRKIKYHPKTLKSIYFGVNADENFINEIKEIAKRKNPYTKFYFGELKSNEFGLKWVEG